MVVLATVVVVERVSVEQLPVEVVHIVLCLVPSDADVVGTDHLRSIRHFPDLRADRRQRLSIAGHVVRFGRVQHHAVVIGLVTVGLVLNGDKVGEHTKFVVTAQRFGPPLPVLVVYKLSVLLLERTFGPVVRAVTAVVRLQIGRSRPGSH